MADILPLRSGSVDPQILADPDPGSQIVADLTDPDPKMDWYDLYLLGLVDEDFGLKTRRLVALSTEVEKPKLKSPE